MKTLILIRHAKSSWEDDVTDLNRPLSLRGFSDANSISKEFKSYDFHPDGIFSSPAKRAATTCDVFMENLKLSKSYLTKQIWSSTAGMLDKKENSSKDG